MAPRELVLRSAARRRHSVTPARIASSISAGSSVEATMTTPVAGCWRLSSAQRRRHRATVRAGRAPGRRAASPPRCASDSRSTADATGGRRPELRTSSSSWRSIAPMMVICTGMVHCTRQDGPQERRGVAEQRAAGLISPGCRTIRPVALLPGTDTTKKPTMLTTDEHAGRAACGWRPRDR